MFLEIYQDVKQMDQRAAEIVAETVQNTDKPVLGLATGSTPIGMYEALIAMYKQGSLSFKNAHAVNLDEYVGLTADHPQSYEHFMNVQLFNHIDLPQTQRYIPDGIAEDLEAECARYEAVMAKLGRNDVQVLGIGHNGHIGFNEPAPALKSRTHVVELDDETIKANARFFHSQDEVPRQAITVGMSAILKSKKILLLAKGESKADILYEALKGPITTQCPASLLQTHPNLYVLVDEAAGRRLT